MYASASVVDVAVVELAWVELEHHGYNFSLSLVFSCVAKICQRLHLQKDSLDAHPWFASVIVHRLTYLPELGVGAAAIAIAKGKFIANNKWCVIAIIFSHRNKWNIILIASSSYSYTHKTNVDQ